MNNCRSSNCGCGTFDTCGCTDYSCPTPTNTPSVATTIYVANSWSVPALNGYAELDVPKVKTFQVGTYISNPSYGKFLVTSFNSSTGKLTIQNTGFQFNQPAGYVVPANSMFIPEGPAFQKRGTFTVVPMQQGSLAITLDATDFATYKMQDDELIFEFQIDVTLAGSGDTIGIKSPFTGVTGYTLPLLTLGKNNTATAVLMPAHLSTPDLILIQKQDLSNFTVAVSSTFTISGRYPLAAI